MDVEVVVAMHRINVIHLRLLYLDYICPYLLFASV